MDSGHDALWVLPSVTPTRALRFAHAAPVTDPIFGGKFTGAYVLSSRLVNLAPQAMATAKSGARKVGRLNDEIDDGSVAWDNLPPNGDRPNSIAEDPEWVMLTWPNPVTINGLASLGIGYSAAEVQIYRGPANILPNVAPDSDWKTIQTVSGLRNIYPGVLPVNWIDMGGAVNTLAI